MLELGLPALVLVLVALAWYSALAARESARYHARILCRRAHLQLLDDTVALTRLRWDRNDDGRLQLVRRYRFEVSSDGHDRLAAELHLQGTELAGYTLPEVATGPTEGGTVVRLPLPPPRVPPAT